MQLARDDETNPGLWFQAYRVARRITAEDDPETRAEATAAIAAAIYDVLIERSRSGRPLGGDENVLEAVEAMLRGSSPRTILPRRLPMSLARYDVQLAADLLRLLPELGTRASASAERRVSAFRALLPAGALFGAAVLLSLGLDFVRPPTGHPAVSVSIPFFVAIAAAARCGPECVWLTAASAMLLEFAATLWVGAPYFFGWPAMYACAFAAAAYFGAPPGPRSGLATKRSRIRWTSESASSSSSTKTGWPASPR
jgi:hypothetical protein